MVIGTQLKNWVFLTVFLSPSGGKRDNRKCIRGGCEILTRICKVDLSLSTDLVLVQTKEGELEAQLCRKHYGGTLGDEPRKA